MNLRAEEEYKKADAELNRIYNQIIHEYKFDEEFIMNLRSSERLWIQFRDAELLLKYPENIDLREGSVYPLCQYNYLRELTEQRIKTLKKWLVGEEEGEVCSGSIKLKNEL